MKHIICFIWSCLILILIHAGCSPNHKTPDKEQLIKTDKAFSNLSEEKGMNYAFLEYADQNCVMLRNNNLPLEGKEALIKLYEVFSDTGFVLTWKPLFADIARSGEMGYTYGIYTSLEHDSIGNITERNGTYVSIWKKDEKGNWKFVLDSGNEGLGEQD